MHRLPFLMYSFILALLISCNGNKNQESTDSNVVAKDTVLTEEQIIQKAREIHDRVITLDTHDDINTANFTLEKNYTQDLNTQVNLPKMENGGLDVSWMIVYTGQGDLNAAGYRKAYDNAMDKFNAIHRLCEDIAPDRVGLAYTSDDVRRIAASGRKVVMIGVENAYSLGLDIGNVKKFYDLGGRYMSLAHNGHSQFSDSNTGEKDGVWLHNGLSDLGKQVIAEMNKLGMLVDISHPSKEANKQAIVLSKAPVIASHSSSRALCDHSRNLDDEMLELIKQNGGVVQAVALDTYLNKEKSEAYTKASRNLLAAIALKDGWNLKERADIRDMSDSEREIYFEKYRTLQEQAKPQLDSLKEKVEPVSVSDLVDHIDYLVEKMGIDHVGISSDFDGGGGIEGWNDSSETFNVTLELVRRGYTEEEIAKIWSGNLLRALDDAQKVASGL